MHLPHTLPGLWYMAELAAPGLHVTGVTLPGVPGVVVGHNDTIAWGFTNLGGDVQDIYVEHTRNRQEYQTTDGAWHPLVHHTEVIRVRGGLDITLDVLSTNHGPIITPMLQRGDPGMSHETRDLSLRWSIYDPGTVDLPLLAIDSATTGQSSATPCHISARRRRMPSTPTPPATSATTPSAAFPCAAAWTIPAA